MILRGLLFGGTGYMRIVRMGHGWEHTHITISPDGLVAQHKAQQCRYSLTLYKA